MRSVIFTSSTLIISQVLTSIREVWDIMSGVYTDSGLHPNISTGMDISTL